MKPRGLTRSMWTWTLQLLSLIVVVCMIGWVFVRSDRAALAQPAPPVRIVNAEPAAASSSPTASAPVAAVPSASASVAAVVADLAPPAFVVPSEAVAVEPIDLATVGEAGGVPRHPAGTTIYRSPFAKPNAGPPVRVKVGLLLNSVDDYDIKTGTFSADFFLSLTSDKPMPKLDLQFPTGKVEQTEIIADKPTFKLQRLSGVFKSPPDLRKFPFDSQELKIVIEDDRRGIDQVRLSADANHTQLARGFRALGWQVGFLEARALSQAYPDRFEGDDLYYGRYIFTLGLDRYATSAAFTVYVPALVIVLIALLGMWVPPKEMEVRSNSGAPMLAGAVLFHFGLMQELPATSYLTRADKLMLGVYLSLSLGMISTWWMFLVKEEHVEKVFRIARVVVPILTAVVMAFAMAG
jgi:hypothetical protein